MLQRDLCYLSVLFENHRNSRFPAFEYYDLCFHKLYQRILYRDSKDKSDMRFNMPNQVYNLSLERVFNISAIWFYLHSMFPCCSLLQAAGIRARLYAVTHETKHKNRFQFTVPRMVSLLCNWEECSSAQFISRISSFRSHRFSFLVAFRIGMFPSCCHPSVSHWTMSDWSFVEAGETLQSASSAMLSSDASAAVLVHRCGFPQLRVQLVRLCGLLRYRWHSSRWGEPEWSWGGRAELRISSPHWRWCFSLRVLCLCVSWWLSCRSWADIPGDSRAERENGEKGCRIKLKMKKSL